MGGDLRGMLLCSRAFLALPGIRALDLTQIRYFLTLARSLNFTRAAAECGVTQPALSRGIQRLEVTLGAPLLYRERSLTQLTEFGRVMLPLLEEVQAAADAAHRRAEERRRDRDEAPLRLGICAFLAMGPLLGPLREVTDAVAGASLDLRRGAEAALTEWLMQGTLDLAVLPCLGPVPERVQLWPLWTMGLEAWLPERHVLARESGPLPIGALRDHPMIALATDEVADAARAGRLGRWGLVSPPRHSAAGPEELATMVALGLGWGMVPEGTAVPPGVRARPLVGDPPLRIPVALAGIAGRPMNRAVRHFHRLVRAHFAEASVA